VELSQDAPALDAGDVLVPWMINLLQLAATLADCPAAVHVADVCVCVLAGDEVSVQWSA
jgi:hypothetical protein